MSGPATPTGSERYAINQAIFELTRRADARALVRLFHRRSTQLILLAGAFSGRKAEQVFYEPIRGFETGCARRRLSADAIPSLA